MTESVTYVLETNNKIYEESEDVWEKMRTLQILITTMLVALLFINIFTFNVSYVRAESATTDISNSATADVSIDYEKIQEEFEQVNTELIYMIKIWILIFLGTVLGDVVPDILIRLIYKLMNFIHRK